MPDGVTGNPAIVRVAGNTDRRAIAAMLARAFADDPAMAFIFPDPVLRAKRMPRLFGLLFDEDAGVGMRLVSAGEEAATLWRGPGMMQTSRLTMLRQAVPMLLTFGSALGRALAVADSIEANFPTGNYWYLHIAGCDTAAQGKGFGRALVQSGLDRVAGGGLPACLETANEANLGFYQSLGFNVVGDWRVPKGGPRFWSMSRTV